jgi:hypothetical protein
VALWVSCKKADARTSCFIFNCATRGQQQTCRQTDLILGLCFFWCLALESSSWCRFFSWMDIDIDRFVSTMDSANHIQIQIAQCCCGYDDGFFLGEFFLLKKFGSLHLNKQKNIRYVCLKLLERLLTTSFILCLCWWCMLLSGMQIFHFASIQSLDGLSEF